MLTEELEKWFEEQIKKLDARYMFEEEKTFEWILKMLKEGKSVDDYGE